MADHFDKFEIPQQVDLKNNIVLPEANKTTPTSPSTKIENPELDNLRKKYREANDVLADQERAAIKAQETKNEPKPLPKEVTERLTRDILDKFTEKAPSTGERKPEAIKSSTNPQSLSDYKPEIVNNPRYINKDNNSYDFTKMGREGVPLSDMPFGKRPRTPVQDRWNQAKDWVKSFFTPKASVPKLQPVTQPSISETPKPVTSVPSNLLNAQEINFRALQQEEESHIKPEQVVQPKKTDEGITPGAEIPTPQPQAVPSTKEVAPVPNGPTIDAQISTPAGKLSKIKIETKPLDFKNEEVEKKLLKRMNKNHKDIIFSRLQDPTILQDRTIFFKREGKGLSVFVNTSLIEGGLSIPNASPVGINIIFDKEQIVDLQNKVSSLFPQESK